MGNTCLRDEDEVYGDSGVDQDAQYFNTRSSHAPSECTILSSDDEEDPPVQNPEGCFWIIDGIIGSGRSSTLNTLFNSNVCKVAGGQVQGTRGAAINVFQPTRAIPDDEAKEVEDEISHPIHYIDVEGFRSDIDAKREEVLSHVETLYQSVSLGKSKSQNGSLGKSEILMRESFCANTHNHQYLFVLDLQQRSTAPILDNLLTLTDLYFPVRKQCVLCLTKWNTNSVMSEWNHKLRSWSRKHKRSFDSDDIQADLPSTSEMLCDFAEFLKSKFGTCSEVQVLHKVIELLAFFEDRIIWTYNLDCLEVEDREDGELPAFKEYMYTHYRSQAISKLQSHSRDLLRNKKVSTNANLIFKAAKESVKLEKLAGIVELIMDKKKKRGESISQQTDIPDAKNKLDLLIKKIISRSPLVES